MLRITTLVLVLLVSCGDEQANNVDSAPKSADAAMGDIFVGHVDQGWPMLSGASEYLFMVPDAGNAPFSLAGDFNQWQPEAMTKANGYWWIIKRIDNPVDARYKFISSGGNYFADPLARAYRYDEFGEMSLVRASRSHLRRYFDFGRPQLASRQVTVWVPAASPTHHL